MRFQLETPIVAHTRLDEYEYELILRAPEIAREAQPGQFVQLLCGKTYVPFTRRPFSVFWVDPAEGTFGIVYLARGSFTRLLATRQPGETVSVVGPLGNSFEADPAPAVYHILVAGGVGAPPLYFMAQALSGSGATGRVSVINGARTRSLVVGEKEFGGLGVDLQFTTDDGSLGRKGLVVDALAPLLEQKGDAARVYTCGPTPMLRAVADMCLARGVPCQVSVETVMPCGVGVCMGCVVKIRDEASPQGFTYKRSCFDGPVFRADEVIWE